MTRLIASLALSLTIAGCAQKQQKEVPYLPEDGAEAAPAKQQEAEPAPEASSDEPATEGEIDLGLEGEYKGAAVDAEPEEGSGDPMPSVADKSCEEPSDCEGDPNMDAMGTWDCQQSRCIYTPKINLDTFKPK